MNGIGFEAQQQEDQNTEKDLVAAVRRGRIPSDAIFIEDPTAYFEVPLSPELPLAAAKKVPHTTNKNKEREKIEEEKENRHQQLAYQEQIND